MLTQDQIDAFHRDGYLAVRQAVSPDNLERLRTIANSWLDRSRELTESDDVFELETGHTADSPRLRRVNHPVKQDPFLWETASSERQLDIVGSLLGGHLKFHHSKLNMKASKGGSAIGWHQDFAFFPHTNTDLVACGIALDDATLENGCLMVIPGSHQLGLLDHRDARDAFTGSITSDAERLDEAAAVPVELKAGDMSIHHVLTVHGSSANTSGRSRRLLIFQYAAADAIQLEPKSSVNEFSDRVVRGGPVTHARLTGPVTYRLRCAEQGARSIFERQAAAR